MRIGIDCRLWKQTGVGRYTKNIVLNLQKIDERNKYFLFVRTEDHESIRKRITNPNWRLIQNDIKWHSFSEQLKFPRLIRRERLDLMHFPYFSVPIFYKRPYVVTIHDLIINHFSTGKASTLLYPLYLVKREAYGFVIEQAARKAKKIIAPSNATKQEIMEHFKIAENKINIVCEASNFKPQALNSEPQDTKYQILNTKYFLYVGNAYPHKNLEALIEAFKRISAEHEDLKLILVGERDYFYKRLEKENTLDKIIFYGKATDKELANLYTNAIALVAPSLMEGFGLPVLEAMSLSCLVLASDIPAFREIAGDSAIYFNLEDKNDLYSKLKDIAENMEVHKEAKLEIALKRSQQFSWEKAAEQTLNIYESSLSL
jgi:glycosyltransferase involved in cell wall biosynthesis